MDVNENTGMGNKSAREADQYFKKYRSQMEALEKSPLAKTKQIGQYDHYALGKQLAAFESYKEMCEEDGSIAQLGKIPNIALDVITIAYGASPMTALASIQPIDEERGTVYYKKVVAQTNRGSHAQGDTAFDPTQGGIAPLEGYAGDTIVESMGDTAAGTQNYTGNLTNVPLRPQYVTIEIALSGGSLTLTDNGEGLLVGFKAFGTIDYATGAYDITLHEDPNEVAAMTAETATNFEEAPDIPKIIFKLTDKSIRAKVWALKDTVGLEQSYAMKKRFGMVAEDEIANDLVASINSEMLTYAIKRLSASAVGNTTFSKAAPSAVSDYDHRMSFKFKIAEAESKLLGNAGRGNISVMVAGLNVCAILSTLPGFEKISDGQDIGPHIFGTLDGVTVIRVHNANILSPDEMLGIYRGTSPFDAALVWAPYMPLVVTTAMPTGANPLTSQKAAAVWGGLDILATNFVTKITLV